MKEPSNPPAIVRPAVDLVAAAGQINHNYRKIGQDDRKIEQLRAENLDRARESGELLIMVKKEVGHSNWTRRREEHVECSQPTTSKFMAIAKGWDKIKSDCKFSNLSLNQAYRLAKSRKAKSEAEDGGGKEADSTAEQSGASSTDREHDCEAEGGGEGAGAVGAEEGGRAEDEGAHGGDEDAEEQGGRRQQAADGAETKGRAKKLKTLCASLARSLDTLLAEGDGQGPGPDLQAGHYAALGEIARDKTAIDPKVKKR